MFEQVQQLLRRNNGVVRLRYFNVYVANSLAARNSVCMRSLRSSVELFPTLSNRGGESHRVRHSKELSGLILDETSLFQGFESDLLIFSKKIGGQDLMFIPALISRHPCTTSLVLALQRKQISGT